MLITGVMLCGIVLLAIVWQPVLVALAAATGAVVTGLCGYVVVRRTASGKVETSDAKTLWDAAEAIRKELRDELVMVRARLAGLEVEHAACKDRIADLESQVARLRSGMGRDD